MRWGLNNKGSVDLDRVVENSECDYRSISLSDSLPQSQTPRNVFTSQQQCQILHYNSSFTPKPVATSFPVTKIGFDSTRVIISTFTSTQPNLTSVYRTIHESLLDLTIASLWCCTDRVTLVELSPVQMLTANDPDRL